MKMTAQMIARITSTPTNEMAAEARIKGSPLGSRL
jgi:hypothetical protein